MELPLSCAPVRMKECSCLQTAPPGEQVEDEDDHCKDKQDVDEAAADVKAEAKEPEDEEYDDDRPKHISCSPFEVGQG
jgi:hypothetical protein